MSIWARWAPAVFVLPLSLVLALVFLWPLFDSAINSLHPFSRAGIDRATWTLANYTKLFDAYYIGILWRTIHVSLIVTGVTACLAYPVAIYIIALRPRAQALFLLIYMTPWLVNVVVKAFGWSLLLSSNGVINQALKALGIIDTPLRLMLNETGIAIGLIHGHFIFVLLPLWAALGGLDPNLRWAAANLGARPWSIFRRVTLPLTLPALVAGLIINFTMNMTAFATPALLGGARARVASYLAYEVNLVELNWPLGSAMAVGLLAVSLALVFLSQRATAAGKRR
ncbi:MAG: ABC transporter permease, partial [Alphaproteobacteria bacterium]|nr:ABC transporter permease [Alphaproteobacteria bacterium]